MRIQSRIYGGNLCTGVWPLRGRAKSKTIEIIAIAKSRLQRRGRLWLLKTRGGGRVRQRQGRDALPLPSFVQGLRLS